MLILRDEQTRILARDLRRRLQDDAFHHLRMVWGPETAAFDDAALREFVATGYRRAATFGLDFEADIITLLEAFLLFGSGFVESPEHPWAAQLANPRVRADVKASNLRNRMQYELKRIAEPESKPAKASHGA